MPSESAQEPAFARIFDADRTDERLPLSGALRRRLGSNQLLWVDIEAGSAPAAVADLADRLELDVRTRAVLSEPGSGPYLRLHGQHFHLRVMTMSPETSSDDPSWLDIIATRNHIVTAHQDPIPFLQRMDERIEADATLGRLDGPAFARSILDAVVTSYFEGVDDIEAEVDRLDARSLGAEPSDDLLGNLVEVRHRIAKFRRALSAHREVYATLATADLSKISDDEELRLGFVAVASRFESAIQTVEDSRDLLLGSFDVFMTRTAQRTNDVMKILALATVLLLPGSLIAGLLGMNVVVPLPKDDPVSFWLVLAIIGLLAAGVLVVAWRNRWIRSLRRVPPPTDDVRAS